MQDGENNSELGENIQGRGPAIRTLLQLLRVKKKTAPKD